MVERERGRGVRRYETGRLAEEEEEPFQLFAGFPSLERPEYKKKFKSARAKRRWGCEQEMSPCGGLRVDELSINGSEKAEGLKAAFQATCFRHSRASNRGETHAGAGSWGMNARSLIHPTSHEGGHRFVEERCLSKVSAECHMTKG
ncbi:uncharacterized protein LOC116944874 isoform X2 [Petromyzon marinus]|uniref:uncharacterized protein LOC116944874 isoform X2 n=1 Tax=Petromyzon marinus TaxID=7757 RepID=UPI003F6EE417